MIRSSSNEDNNLGLNLPTDTQLDNNFNSGDAITPQIANFDSSLGITSDSFIESEVVSEQLTEPTYNYSDGLNSNSIWDSNRNIFSTEAIDNAIDDFSTGDLLLVNRDNSDVTDKEINFLDPGIERENKSNISSSTVPDLKLQNGLFDRDDINIITGEGQPIPIEQSDTDLVGNSFAQAKDLGTITDTTTFSESVGNQDPIDFYQFNLDTEGTVEFNLSGLSADANIAIFDGNRNRLAGSARTGTRNEYKAVPDLAAGDYYVKVFQKSGNTDYDLTLDFEAANADLAGNSFAQAKDLGTVTDTKTFSESVGNQDPVDFYQFNLDTEGTVEFNLSGLSANANIAIFDGDRNRLAVSARTGTRNEYKAVPDLAAGDYYVKVFQKSGNTDYDLTLDFEAANVDLAGNSFAQAKDLGTVTDTTTFSESVGNQDPVDFYQFNLDTEGTVEFNLTGLSADANIAIFDGNRNRIAGSARTGTRNEYKAVPDLAAGDYYVKVFQKEGDTNYDLTLDFEAANVDLVGNSFAQAKDLGIVTDTTTFSESVGNQDPVDFYQFNLNTEGTVEFNLSGLSADANITIFDGNRNRLAGSARTGTRNEYKAVPDLAAGDYYVKVFQKSGNTDYDLTLSLTDEPEITVTYPNGGDQLEAGTDYDITWTDNIDENVNIDLYRDDTYVQTIVANTPSDGLADWTVPTNLPISDRYKIKVSQVGDNSISDLSDNYFSIEPKEISNYQWRADYFNNTNLSGDSVFTEYLGNGEQNLSQNWDRNSPNSRINNDYFSARITTKRDLEAGWYQVQSGSDDGIRVIVDDRLIINSWVDRGFTEDSDYQHFYFDGGETEIKIEYYDKTGIAALDFKLQEAKDFESGTFPASELIEHRIDLDQPGLDWKIEHTGDFNGDGTDDVLLRNDNGLIHTWLLDNNAKIIDRVNLEHTSWDWNIEQVGDFNGDGTDDVLIRRYDGQVHSWLLENAQIKSRVDLEHTSWDWNIEQVGDFNGDGTDDVLIRRFDGRVHSWLLENAQIKSRVDLEHTSWDWNIEQVGDLNEDGTTDIINRKYNGHVHAWLLNEHGGIANRVDLEHTSFDWNIQGTGDFNNDGTADVLIRRYDGRVHTWLLKDGHTGTDCDHEYDYYPELASLSDDDWDRQSGDNILFDGNLGNGESRNETKAIFGDLLNTVFGGNHPMSAGYIHDYSYLQGIGWLHDGIDIAAPLGTEARMAVDGEVVFTNPDYFGVVTVKDEQGKYHIYKHLDTISVSVGQQINSGDKVGTVGGRGEGRYSFGSHLHYEILNSEYANGGSSVYGSVNIGAGLYKNESDLKEVTQSPLQAFWKFKNDGINHENCNNGGGDFDISAVMTAVPSDYRNSTTRNNITKILDVASEAGLSESQVAYVLATVQHETAHQFQPVSEAYWLDDPNTPVDEADIYLRDTYPYSRYYPYYGRGYVQLTWEGNYQDWSNRLGQDFVGNPDLANNPDFASQILVYGMRDGTFTGLGLDRYINDAGIDFINARRIVNGTDRAPLIAGYANNYYNALT